MVANDGWAGSRSQGRQPPKAVAAGQPSAVTERIRVGSGGVMLPNHASLNVAERFHTLEALFPGRIDLGIGRAPGTDPITSLALRMRQQGSADDDFLERLQELLLMETRGYPESHPFRSVQAMPADVKLPPIWLLGSSDYSSQLAAAIGAGFAFAHHFASPDAAAAMRSYREHFRPSSALDQPRAILGVAAVAADTDAEADRLMPGPSARHQAQQIRGERNRQTPPARSPRL